MIVEFGNEVQIPEKNEIINRGDIEFVNSKITFRGKGNIVYAEGPVRLQDSHILFNGDNAVIYLSQSKKPYKLVIDLWRDTAAYFGSDNYFNGAMHAIVSERKNLIVGDDGIFSFGIWIRTADPHLIYDIESCKRINLSKSVLIGDHVWIGQNALLLKGTEIGSGSIVSANAVMANKRAASNSIYAGNPAKQIRTGVFFLGDSAHNYTAKNTKNSRESDVKDFIYKSGQEIDRKALDKALSSAGSAEEKITVLQSVLKPALKDRFYIAGETKAPQKKLWFLK